MLRHALVPLAAVLTIASTAPALADSGADEADLRFARGTSLYKAGRFEEALGEFFVSNRLAPNRNVVFNIARSYEALKRHEEAYRYYAEYRAAETDPEEQQIADRKLAQLAPLVALVRIESDPPGATVYIDRKDLGGRGATPLLIAQSPGEHQIILELDGYRPHTAKASLERGREIAVSQRLDLIVGTLRIESDPPARIYVDRAAGDSRTADAPLAPAALELTPGRHSVELEADGYRARRADVVVHPDAETKLSVALEEQPPPSGTVVLASSIKGALVMVDGKEGGFTPAVLSLIAGSHDIEVREPGYQPWKRTVVVEQDARAFYQVELSELEREVTGATRTQQSVSSAPASITLITRQEMWAFGYQKLTEALRGVRGYYDSDDRNYESLGVRGFSRPGDYTNRVLVIRDGHALNDDWIGSAPVGRDFAADLDDVSRIEVVRGPGSTFYGQGAFFGVVNVVSLAPGDGPAVRGGGGLDSEGGGNAFAHGTQSVGPASVSVHASVFDSDGRTFQFDEFDSTPSGGLVRNTDAETAQRGALRVTAGELALDAGYNRRVKQIPTASFETVFDPGESMTTGRRLEETVDQRGFVEARWEHQRDRYRLGARLAYDHQQYDGVYPYDDGTDAFVLTDAGGGDWGTAEVRGAVNVLGQWLTVGGELARHRVTQSVDEDDDGANEFFDKREYNNAAVYAADEIALGKRLAVTAGIRADRFGEQADAAVSPRVGAVLRPYGAAFTKLVVGRAYRSPSVYELYYNDNGLTQIPALDLDPETVWSGEIEHTHPIGSRSFLLASAFASRIEGLIIGTTNPDDLLVFANSTEEVRTFGGEVEARLTAEGGAWVGGAFSYTHLDSDDRAVFVNSAETVAAARGMWPLTGERLALAAEVIYNSPRRLRESGQTGHSVLGNLFLSGALGGNDLKFRAGVTNILDWDRRVAVGEELLQEQILQAPRTFVAELVYQHE